METNTTKNIRDDLLLFKNDTLKDIKEAEKTILEKYRNIEFKLNEKLELFENEFKKFDTKVIEMSAFLETLKGTNDNISQLLQYKSKSENSIFDLDLKLRTLDKESHDSLYNISNILKDSIIYPGTIGSSAKFKTFHDFIDFVLMQLSNFRQFKEKITKEVNENKNRADSGIDKLKASHDMLLEKTKALVVNEVISLEEKNNSFFKLYDEKFQKIRVDNEKFGLSIKTNEELVSNFKKDIQDMNLKKNELITKISELAEKNKQNNREINSLKDKFVSLTNYIKQLKFKKEKEDQEDLNKKIIDIEKTLNLHELSNSNKELIKIKLKKNSSGLKEYIKGKININQLQSLSNKNNLKPTESIRNYNYNNNNDNNNNNNNYNNNNYKDNNDNNNINNNNDNYNNNNNEKNEILNNKTIETDTNINNNNDINNNSPVNNEKTNENNDIKNLNNNNPNTSLSNLLSNISPIPTHSSSSFSNIEDSIEIKTGNTTPTTIKIKCKLLPPSILSNSYPISVTIKNPKPIQSSNFFQNNYVEYEIETITNNNNIIVKRRYSDFEWLRNTLLKNNPGLMIPP